MKLRNTFVSLSIVAMTASCGSSSSSGDGGAAGKTGSAGGSGNAGSMGTAGSTGTAGNTGAAGTSGAAGGTSMAGSTGTAGSVGGAGAGGAGGTMGTAGSIGSNGTMVMGSADGTLFANVGSVFLIGNPDVAASTVVYIFSKTIKCSDISQAGWDATITDKTQILELKMMGTTPATYQPIIKAPRFPAAGEAQVNYALSAQTGTVAETFSTTGSVTLSKITAKVSASGSFDLTFGANALKGTFAAIYCDVGREP